VLQVIDNIAAVILTNEMVGEKLYTEISALLHLVDIICCCAVLIPIVWQVNLLEQEKETNANDDDNMNSSNEETMKTLAKLKLFRSFYLLVILYIYFTRIIIFLFASLLGYKLTWLRYFVTEIVTLTFYALTGYKFRPMAENPYFELRNKSVNDEEMRNSERSQES